MGFRLPNSEELPLTRMRHAFRSLQMISAFSAATFLWPLLLTVFALAYDLLGGQSEMPLHRPAFWLFLVVVTGLTALLWLTVDCFLSSTGSITVIVSLAVAAGFMFLNLGMQFDLVGLGGAPAPIERTLGIAFTLTVSFLFLVHGVRVGLLPANERRAITRRLPSQRFWQNFVAPLLLDYGHRTTLARRFAAAAVLLAARIAQGVGLFGLGFAFGATVFTGSTLFFGALLVIIQEEAQSPEPGVMSGLLVNVAKFYVVLALIVLAFVQASIALKRAARRMLRTTYERQIELDERDRILFLRHFLDDQVTLPASRLYARYWLAEPNPRRLDHELVERYSRVGPITAVGRPGDEGMLPFGAARVFFTNEDWQPGVLELAEHAQSVVVVVDESRGVNWETEQMLSSRFVEKTLFLASPGFSNPGLGEHSVLGPVLREEAGVRGDSCILGAWRVNGVWSLLSPMRCAADDYVVCCEAFFRRAVVGTARPAKAA